MEQKRKKSIKRDAILSCLKGTVSHPTAEWIYLQLKPDFPDLSLGTVYRNLAEFKEDGIIADIGEISGNARYDGNTSPHAHFACLKCGTVQDVFDIQIPCPELSGAIIQSSTLLYTGVCSRCADNK